MVSVTHLMYLQFKEKILDLLSKKEKDIEDEYFKIIEDDGRYILEINLHKLSEKYMCSEQTIINAFLKVLQDLREKYEIKNFKYRNNYYVILKALKT